MSGPHSIPTEILKLIKLNICYPVRGKINLSFATGVYPDLLKIAVSSQTIDQFLSYQTLTRYLITSLSIFYSFLTQHNCKMHVQKFFLRNLKLMFQSIFRSQIYFRCLCSDKNRIYIFKIQNLIL